MYTIKGVSKSVGLSKQIFYEMRIFIHYSFHTVAGIECLKVAYEEKLCSAIHLAEGMMKFVDCSISWFCKVTDVTIWVMPK